MRPALGLTSEDLPTVHGVNGGKSSYLAFYQERYGSNFVCTDHGMFCFDCQLRLQDSAQIFCGVEFLFLALVSGENFKETIGFLLSKYVGRSSIAKKDLNKILEQTTQRGSFHAHNTRHCFGMNIQLYQTCCVLLDVE